MDLVCEPGHQCLNLVPGFFCLPRIESVSSASPLSLYASTAVEVVLFVFFTSEFIMFVGFVGECFISNVILSFLVYIFRGGIIRLL